MYELNVQDVVATVTLIVAILALYFPNRKFTKIEAFYTHSATHPIPGTADYINTHAVVLRNIGSASASNIRIIHNILPNNVSINIFPIINYQRHALPVGGEIVIEKLRPKEQLTLSYLYPSDILWHQIGLSVKHDEGFAEIFAVDFVRLFPKWVRYVVTYLMFVGLLVTTWYLAQLIVPLFFISK